MMMPRQAPLACGPVTVLYERNGEGRPSEATQTVALAAGRRDLPARAELRAVALIKDEDHALIRRASS
jgi:hypothetical protein